MLKYLTAGALLFTMHCSSSSTSPDGAVVPDGALVPNDLGPSPRLPPTCIGSTDTSVPAVPPAFTVPANLPPADVRCAPVSRPALVSGKWQTLGPPGVDTADYGAMGITIDPSNPDVIYVTIQDAGIWKSCDRGGSWMRLGTPGTDPDQWDNFTNYLSCPFEVQVDPQNPQHLYATVGVRGLQGEEGFWISFDGGAIWRRSDGFAAVGKETTFDTTDIAVDPCNFQHVLVAGHSWWNDVTKNAGVLESTDAGETWIKHQPDPAWTSGTNGIEFAGDSNTWLNMTGAGFWLTTNAGASWTPVTTTFGEIHGLDVLYRASSTTLYAGANYHPVRSTDNGLHWDALTNLPMAPYYVVWGDGTHLYTAAQSTDPNSKNISYYTSLQSDGTTWTKMGEGDATQVFSQGPIVMKYDATNHIVYSVNWKQGVLALSVAP